MADKDVIKLLNEYFSDKPIDPLSQSLLEDIKASVEAQVDIANKQQLESKEVKKVFEAIRAYLKAEGLSGTKFSGKLTQVQGAMLKDSTIVKLDKLERLLSNLISSGVIQTQMSASRGDKNGIFSQSSRESVIYKQIVSDLSKNQKANIMFGITGLQRWLLSSANNIIADQDKKNKGLVNALIDGLAANKFVGGALQDTTKLMGLMLGSWVKNKVGGPLGGLLGAGTVVLSQIVASVVPIVLQTLLQMGTFRLFGPMMGLGGGVAGGSAGGGLLASLFGAKGKSSPVKTITKLTATDAAQVEAAKKAARMTTKRTTSTGNVIGAMRKGPKPLPAGAKLSRDPGALVASLNKNTAALTKNAGWLGKITSSPIMKVGGSVLGKVFGAVGAISSLGSFGDAYSDFKQGNAMGGTLRGLQGALGVGAGVAAMTGAGLPVALGLGLLSAGAGWLAGKTEESQKKTLASDVFGNTTGAYFWVNPQHHLVGGKPSYGGTQGGRSYINKGAVPNASKIINLQSAHLSSAGVHLITKPGRDSLHTTPYKGKGEKYYTAGYGHYGPDVKPGQTISKEQALKWFRNDVKVKENAVKRLVKVPLTQNMLDSLVSFVYNIGEGNFKGSTALTRLNAGDYTGAAEAMKLWNRGSNKKVLPGLVTRRNEEAALFLKDLVAPKATPKATSQQTVTIQTPSVSSTTEEVKAPQPPKDEENKRQETKVKVPDLLKIGKPDQEVKSGEKQESTTPSSGLTTDIMKSILKGIDVPGNDTTFDILTKCNNVGLFGGQ